MPNICLVKVRHSPEDSQHQGPTRLQLRSEVVLTIGEFQYCRITVTYKTPQHVTLQNALTFFTAPCMDIVDGTCATPTVIHAAHLQSWLNQGLIGLKSEEKYNMFISSMYNGSLKNTVLTGTRASHSLSVHIIWLSHWSYSNHRLWPGSVLKILLI